MKEALVLLSILLATAIAVAWRTGYADDIRAAWSVLQTYGPAAIVLACAAWWLVMRGRLTNEHQAIAQREAAADLQEAGVRITMAEAERIQKAAQNQVQAAKDEATKREQEAEKRVKAAEFRLQRSVATNIGLRRQIQKLKKQVNEPDEQATMGHC